VQNLSTKRANRQYWNLLAKRNADCERFWETTRRFLDDHRPPIVPVKRASQLQ